MASKKKPRVDPAALPPPSQPKAVHRRLKPSEQPIEGRDAIPKTLREEAFALLASGSDGGDTADLVKRLEEAIASSSDSGYTVDKDTGLAPTELMRLRRLLVERARRRVSAMALYEALAAQEGFHASRSRIRLLRGSNRGGKTLPAAVEVARAVTGRDPHGKYPPTDGRCFAVGKDLRHIGQVMWRKLSRPGAFKIVRDPVTRAWRAWRPWIESDALLEDKVRPAPPLIPPSMIEEIDWENKKAGIPKTVRLVNGWELSFFSSLGKPPQGSDIDLWWFDEEIVDPDWFPEMSARILDRRGKGIWSATPQAGTEQLYDLHQRAGDCDGAVSEHVILLADNPHIRAADKRALAADLTAEDAAVRIGGEFALLSYRVYPEYSPLLHNVAPFQLPREWTIWGAVDPGHQTCAVLLVAVPPPEHPEQGIWAFDELYLGDCDATKFATHLANKTEGLRIQGLIIDPNMGATTQVASGRTVMQQYSESLEEAGFWAEGTGTGFILGCDNVESGLLAVHEWLRLDYATGKPWFKTFAGRLPHLEDEFRRYVKKREAGRVIDKPNNRRHNHLMDCLRYLALFNPRWVRPRGTKKPSKGGAAVAAFREKAARRAAKAGGGSGGRINLGPVGGNRGR